jgi:hypothetical protein
MMKTKFRLKSTAARRGALLSLPLLAAVASPGYALDVYLKTGTTTITPPGASAPITMWGYQSCDSTFMTCGAISVPGPAINIPATDTTGLTVHLSNTLPEPTSIVIDGLKMPTGSAPVWDDNSTGSRTLPSQRVRSLTTEADPLTGSATYSWPAADVKPGTFLYRSGTHMQVQDQMGLYGAVIKNTLNPVAAAGTTPAVPGQAYGVGSTFDKDVTLLYSEIDPVIHAAVAAGNFGPYPVAGIDQCTLPVSKPRDPSMPSDWVCSTVNYAPKYFLINGQAYNGTGTNEFNAAGVGQKTLLRFLNAGLKSHVPVINGLDMTLLAEDGNLYPHAKTQYSAFLPAMKTMDAIIEPQSNAKLSIMDSMLNLSNNGAGPGGMLAFLNVGAVANPTFALSGCLPGPQTATFNTAFNCTVTAADSAGGTAVTYSLVSGPAGLGIDGITGAVTWTIATPAGSSQAVTVKAADTANPTNATTASFTINVDGIAPTFAQTGCLPGPQTTSLNAAFSCQVTGSDSAGGAAVTYTLISGPALLTMDANGLISWPVSTPAGSSNPVTVQIADSAALANIATTSFTVNVQAPVPVATDDLAIGTTFQGKPLNVAAPGVLGNDTSNVPAPNGGLTARVVATTANGTLALNANGGFTYTPNAGFSGSDSFTYQAVDSTGTASTAATATITVTPNTAPTAVDDGLYTVNASGNFVLDAPGVLANDSDSDNQGQVLTLTKLTNPAHGTVTLNANGGFTYTPVITYVGVDSFTYKVNDGIADSIPATVRFDVVNTAPVAVNDGSAAAPLAVRYNRSLVIGVLLNDSDTENNINTAAVTRVTQALHGNAVVNANGTITYTPALNYVGTDSFTYHVTDKVGVVSNDAVVSVCPGLGGTACPNADSYTAPTGSPASFDVVAPGVLANDIPATGTSAFVSGTLRRNGTTTLLGTTLRCPTPNPGSSTNTTKICANGAFRLNLPTNAANRPGTYTFQYRLTAGGGTSSPVTVTVTVP